MATRAKRLPVTRITTAGEARAAFDDVAVEEPLEIQVGGRALAVVMRTPGHDFELAAGFLHTEGVLDAGAAIHEIHFCPDTETFNVVDVTLRGDPVWHDRAMVASAACGVCGKTSLDDVRRPLPVVPAGPRFPVELISASPEQLRDRQEGFRRTGGLHAAGLLTPAGEWPCVREDIGRHNAVDKVVGWALLQGLVPLHDCALVVSGRAGFEIVVKARAAGLPLLAAVGAPSTLALEEAAAGGMTVAGFVRGDSLNVYCGGDRLTGRGVRTTMGASDGGQPLMGSPPLRAALDP